MMVIAVVVVVLTIAGDGAAPNPYDSAVRELYGEKPSAPADDDEGSAVDEWLNSLPPMAPEARKAFDKAARAMYREDCQCLVYLNEDGEVRRFPLPLDDDDRRILIESIRRGLIVPLETTGDTF